jgi:hypothetical protein
MGSVTRSADDMAREFFDAVEPMFLQLRKELNDRQDKFEAEIRAKLAERSAQAAQIGTVHNFVEGLAYWGNTLVAHRGGLWQAINNTGEEPGTGNDWRLLANGVSDISGYVDEDDPRLLTIGHQMSSGATVNLEVRLPLPLHKGRYEPGTEYQQGDEVAWSGSTWRAATATKTEPPSADWRLVAKAGERGRRGESAA